MIGLHFDAFKVDSFKRKSEIKRHLLFEVDFMSLYAQKERNLSESDVASMVRGVVRFILTFKTVTRSGTYTTYTNSLLGQQTEGWLPYS